MERRAVRNVAGLVMGLVVALGYGPAAYSQQQKAIPGVCCFKSIAPPPGEDFSGRVKEVAKSEGKVVVDRGNVLYTFVLHESASNEQKKLLQRVRVGDTLKGTFMKERGMYHFKLKK